MRDEERIRRVFKELRESSDPDEKAAYDALILGFLKERHYAGQQGDQALGEWAIRHHGNVRVDLAEAKGSLVDRALLSSLTQKYARLDAQLGQIFQSAWDDTMTSMAGRNDESKESKLISRLRFYSSGVAQPQKTEIQKVISMLEDANTNAGVALEAYRVHYLDPTTSQISNEENEDSVNPGPNMATRGPISPREERQKIEPPSPYSPPLATPRDRPPPQLSERTLLEQDVAQLAPRLTIQDLRRLHSEIKARLTQ